MQKFLFMLSAVLSFIAILFSFNSRPVHSIELNQVSTPSPTIIPTIPPTSEPTIVAPIDITDPTYVIMPSRSGNIVDDANDGLIGMAPAPVSVANFVTTARFYNPYSASTGGWTYGFLFRNQTEGQYWITVSSYGIWQFLYRVDNQIVYSDDGYLTNFDTSEGGSNELRLIVNGEEGHFFVNDEEVALLDVSDNLLRGNIAVITNISDRERVLQTITSYEDFTVWSIGLVPTFTPTALPEIGFEAQVGTNHGELELGQGQIWTYDGQAGEVLNIQLNADIPSQLHGVVDPQGLDTLLLVRSPSGSVLLTSDDIETDESDSGYENLVLPEDGIYEFEVRSWNDASAGGYTLVIDSSQDDFATSTPHP